MTIWTPELLKRAQEMRAAGRSYRNIDKALGLPPCSTSNKFWRMSPEGRSKENEARRIRRRELRAQAGKLGSAGSEGRFTVPDSAWIDRDARCAALAQSTITQRLLGDPPPGFSALDRVGA